MRPGGRVIEIGNVSVGEEHEVSLAPGLITRKMIRVQGFVRYQPWYLHKALGFLERKHDDHPFEELTDKEYALKDSVWPSSGRRRRRWRVRRSCRLRGRADERRNSRGYPAIIGGER